MKIFYYGNLRATCTCTVHVVCVCEYLLEHINPTSVLCPHWCVPIGPWGQSNNESSSPRHLTPSSQTGKACVSTPDHRAPPTVLTERV